MPNSIINTCVKYVNNQRTNIDKLSGQLSTIKASTSFTPIIQVVQTKLYKLSLLLLSTMISTYINAIYNLLNKSFTHYPQHLLLEPLKEN